jgi:hypothetical protein
METLRNICVGPKSSRLEAGIKSIIKAARIRIAWQRFAYYRNKARKGN